tara:strand:+ start:197 stop:466 length:270 start_codon:yes stop_codon:yes gene_type:complete
MTDITNKEIQENLENSKSEEDKKVIINDKEFFLNDFNEEQLHMLSTIRMGDQKLAEITAKGALISEGRLSIINKLYTSLESDDNNETIN